MFSKVLFVTQHGMMHEVFIPSSLHVETFTTFLRSVHFNNTYSAKLFEETALSSYKSLNDDLNLKLFLF